MKKILVLSMEYPPNGGGAGTVVKEICTNLRKEYEITLITNNQNTKIKEEFKVIEVKKIPKLTFGNYYFILKKVDLKEYSKIIINDIGASFVASLFFSKEIQKKCILFLHGTEYEEIIEKPNFLFKLFNFSQKYKMLLGNCFKIVAVSFFMKEKFIEKVNEIDLKNKINVIYNGVDSTKFFYEKIDIYEYLKIKKKNKTLLTVSRIVKQKGFLTMLKIFKELLKKQNNLIWIIVGEGKFKLKLKKIIKKEQVDDKIIFIEKKNYNELRKLYSSVDLFWLLSEYEEALGLVYIEAQMCGCKVLGYKNAGVTEAIYDKESFFKSNNDILNILERKKEVIPKEFFLKFTIGNQILQLKRIINNDIEK